MRFLFEFLIFPGFLFSVIIGGILSWFDRKLTARIQYRVGPPWYQPLMDILKLMGKETIIPRGAHKSVFILAPYLGLIALILTCLILWKVNLFKVEGFMGDLIVIIYLLAIPSLAIILAGFASANPLSSLGASREVKLLLSYEFPFLLAILVPILKAGSIRISDILDYQLGNGAILFSFSGFLSFIVVLLCMQAKMGLVPFDIAEAETEIIAGPLTEYSGSLLAIFKLNKMLMLVVMPLFILTCFWNGFGGSNFLLDTLKFLFIVVIFTLIRNTNPRVRIDQAMRFFWFGLGTLALIALVLAMGGM